MILNNIPINDYMGSHATGKEIRPGGLEGAEFVTKWLYLGCAVCHLLSSGSEKVFQKMTAFLSMMRVYSMVLGEIGICRCGTFWAVICRCGPSGAGIKLLTGFWEVVFGDCGLLLHHRHLTFLF